MKNKYTLLLLFTAFCCISLQCKKERTELEMLPPVTSYGANTFGCLINGRAWPVYEKGRHIIDAQYYNGKLNISYTIYEPDPNGGWGLGTVKEYIGFTTDKIHSNGAHSLNYELGVTGFGLEYKGVNYTARYDTNKGVLCYIYMHRLDSVKHILSGEFSFSLADREGKSRVNVEHGRFDIFYQ